MVRVLTPLVILTAIAVAFLGIARLLLNPASWASSLSAITFLPLAIAILRAKSGAASTSEHAAGKLRALRSALVGAGVLLATSLLLSLSDLLGVTDQVEQRLGTSLMAMLGAVIAAAADYFGARSEHKRDKDSE